MCTIAALKSCKGDNEEGGEEVQGRVPGGQLEESSAPVTSTPCVNFPMLHLLKGMFTFLPAEAYGVRTMYQKLAGE